MNVFIDEPVMQLLIRNLVQFIGVIAVYSFLLWLMAEVTGAGFQKPWKTRIKLILAYTIGPLGGLALYGKGLLPLPATEGSDAWGWVLAAITGLACTVAAERLNDSLFGRFLKIWRRDEPDTSGGGS